MKQILAIFLLLSSLISHGERIIHKEKSLYRNIVVNEKAERRCLIFSVKRQQRNQTCIDLSDPNRIIFPYVRMIFSGLLVHPEPKRGLMIGMGGGTISNVLTDVYPNLRMDLVEVDQAVVDVARDYFGFKQNQRTNVYVTDGRVFARRALIRQERYDLIILDAFTGEYIPEHLMTVEFLENIKGLLSPEGVVIANTFSASALYDHESVTYFSVFGDLLSLKMPRTGNRVIVASNSDLPSAETLKINARKLEPRFKSYKLNLRKYISNMERGPDWNMGVRILTDQYAPVNLLRNR